MNKTLNLVILITIFLSVNLSLNSQIISYSVPYSVSTIASKLGNGNGFADGVGTNAIFNQPFAITLDNLGNIYVADQNNYCIRMISTTNNVTTIAGTPGVMGYKDGAGSTSQFGSINGITTDQSGNIYVTDGTYNTVRRISAGTWNVTTIINSNYGLNNPTGITIDNLGNIFIADAGNNVIRKLSTTNTITIYAGILGNGSASPGHLSYPSGICLDNSGNLYIVDLLQSTICKVSVSGVLSIAGGYPGAPGFLDGALTNQTSQFSHPTSICSDYNGNIYIIDGSSGNLIREITPSGIVSTLAGSLIAGGQDGLGGSANFAYAKGITVDKNGILYVANTGTSTIRKCTPPSINTVPAIISNPSTTITNLGSTVSLNVLATGSGILTYQWYLNGSLLKDSKEISGSQSSTLYIQNFTSSLSGQYYVSISNLYGTLNSKIAYIETPPVIQYQPQTQTALIGSNISISVLASGTNLLFQWYLNSEPIPGANSNIYIKQNIQQQDSGTYTVKISNDVSTITSSPAIISILNPIITTQPSSIIVAPGNSIVLNVEATGSSLNYQWYINGAAILGATQSKLTITNSQTSNSGNYTVIVNNIYGSTTSTTANVIVGLNSGRLLNLSVLSLDGPGDQLLTVGFTTGGLGAIGSQTLLVRGCGPTIGLPPYNVQNVLSDPTLTLFFNSKVVNYNDDWATSINNAIEITNADATTGAFPLINTTSLDAALVTNLAPGGYSVQISGKNGATGNVLAEVYDNTPSTSYSKSTPRLVNLSCLQKISSGGFLTAGFVIGGNAALKVLIRAIGPTLAAAPFNLIGVIPDPKISVFNSSSEVLATNIGWNGNAAIVKANADTGAFQFVDSSSKDSAVLLNLQPGSYTVQTTSTSGTSGITLIEVYEVQTSN
jgi:sugar lactone lactonase YvrE